MTKKDYELIAEVIAVFAVNQKIASYDRFALINLMAEALQKDNAKFKHSVFFECIDNLIDVLQKS